MFGTLGVMVLLAIVTAIAAYVSFARQGVRKGRFDPASHLPGHFAFRSDFGLVDFDPQTRTVGVAALAGGATIGIDEVLRAELKRTEDSATLFDDLDTAAKDDARYRVVWHTVVLRLRDGNAVPVFVAGQLERPVDRLTGASSWAHRRGWLPVARAQALRVLGQVAAQLREAREDSSPR